jgi:hypothetical protein
MKLYTEEQVREMLIEILVLSSSVEDAMDSLTPIELPSDEEIETISKEKVNLLNDCFGQYDFTSGKQDGFCEGAIWLRDKIQGGNK